MNVTATLFGQMITFLVLVLFVKEFLLVPLTQVLEDRKKRIADGLAAAERGHYERELGQKRAKEIIHEAREAAAELIEQAQARARDLMEDAQNEARSETERMMNAARQEIDREINRAIEDLRLKIVSLAVMGAEQILRKEVDQQTHNEMLNQLIQKL